MINLSSQFSMLLLALIAAIFSLIGLFAPNPLRSKQLSVMSSILVVLGVFFVASIVLLGTESDLIGGLITSIDVERNHAILLLFALVFSIVSFGFIFTSPMIMTGNLDRFQTLWLLSSVLMFCSSTDVRFMLLAWLLSIVPAMVDNTSGKLKLQITKHRLFIFSQLVGLLMISIGLAIAYNMNSAGKPAETSYIFSHFIRVLLRSNGFSTLATFLIVVGLLMRQGVFPFHQGFISLINKGKLPYSVLFLCSQLGFLLLLLLKNDFQEMSHVFTHQTVLAYLATFSAMYFALLSIVEVNIRKNYLLLLLMHSSLTVLLAATYGGVAQSALYVDIMVVLLVGGGLGLVLWLFERRTGVISATKYLGMAAKMPILSCFFLVFGLGLINFPLTLSFISEDLLLHGVLKHYPILTTLILIAFVITGISFYHFYARLFLGTPLVNISRRDILRNEAMALILIFALIIFFAFSPSILLKVASHEKSMLSYLMMGGSSLY
ncbi:MAG: proton-conducting transporter membrane subunit [Bdellovibrionota bacterium]